MQENMFNVMNNEKDGERFTWKIFNNEAQQTTAQTSCNDQSRYTDNTGENL